MNETLQFHMAPGDRKPPVELRPYQQECIDALLAFHARGGKRALVAIPTGTGKTVVFAHLPLLFGSRTLVLAHREELLDQAAEKLQVANPGLSVEVEQAERKASPNAQVVVASVQTLTVNKRRLQALYPPSFGLVVADEAHHMLAVSWLRVLAHFGLAPLIEDLRDDDLTRRKLRDRVGTAFKEFRPAKYAPFLMGCTATPTRSDGQGLEYVLDELVYSKTIREMMELGWLCKVRGERVVSDADISGVKTRAGDYAESDLSKAVNTETRNALVVQSYQKYARGRKTLVFAVDVEHAKDLAKAFVDYGETADYVLGETEREERRGTIRAFRDGDLPILVNCMVASEGFDVPDISCVIFARPTKSSLVLTQQLGRGTRIAPGKDDLLVIDLVDASKAGVQSLNTLFGLPPKLKLKADEDILTVKKAMDQYEQVGLDALSSATSLEEVKHLAEAFDPLRAASIEPYLEVEMAWVRTPFGYALSLSGGAQMGVVVDLLGHADLRQKVLDREVSVLGQYETAQAALSAAEDMLFATRDDARMYRKDAHWRRDQASEKQVRFAKKLGIKVHPQMSKGDVASLISKALVEAR